MHKKNFNKRPKTKHANSVSKRYRPGGLNPSRTLPGKPVVEFDEVASYCVSLVTTLTGQKVKVFNVVQNKLVFDIGPPIKDKIVTIKWCSHGMNKHKKLQQLALCCANGSIHIYSLEDEQVVLVLAEAHNGPVTDFVCHKDFAFSSSEDGRIAKWRLDTGKLCNTWKGDSGAIYRLSVMSDQEMLISGANAVKVWSTITCKPIQDLVGHTNRVTCLASSGIDKVCLSAAHQDRFINVSTISGASEPSRLTLSVDEQINQLLLSPEATVVGITESGTLVYWNHVNFKDFGTKALVKPSVTLQYRSGSKAMVPILQATFCKTIQKFVLARGETWNLSFEFMKLPDKSDCPNVTIDCDEPDSFVPNKAASHAVPPKVSIRSGAVTKSTGSAGNLTLGEKLGLLQAQLSLQTAAEDLNHLQEKAQDQSKSLPQLADSVARVLGQALHTNDTQLILATLATAPHSIVATIECIDLAHIPALFDFLMSSIVHHKGNMLLHINWLKALFIHHSSRLLSIPGISIILGNLINVLQTHTHQISSLIQLKNRLELMVADATSLRSRKSNQAPLTVYLEGSAVTPTKPTSSE